MRCAACGHENRDAAKFCEECATVLTLACSQCGAVLRPTAKFCDTRGNALEVRDSRRARGRRAGQASSPAIANPHSPRLPPKHLADKILQSKSALKGERKQVTVLFVDVKGSMELAEQVGRELAVEHV